jgi:hypothetical protein
MRNGTFSCKSPPKVLVCNYAIYCSMNTRCVIIVAQQGCALDKGFSAPSMEYLFVGLKKSLPRKLLWKEES